MKRFILLTISLLMATMGFVACDDDPVVPTEPQLEVTANNIAGEWQLSSWKGAPLAEGSYVYLAFDRRERTFCIYQNLDSFSTRELTGGFYIEGHDDVFVPDTIPASRISFFPFLNRKLLQKIKFVIIRSYDHVYLLFFLAAASILFA